MPNIKPGVAGGIVNGRRYRAIDPANGRLEKATGLPELVVAQRGNMLFTPGAGCAIGYRTRCGVGSMGVPLSCAFQRPAGDRGSTLGVSGKGAKSWCSATRGAGWRGDPRWSRPVAEGHSRQ